MQERNLYFFMIIVGLLIGIYAYGIFFLGIGGFLQRENLLWFTLCYLVVAGVFYRRNLRIHTGKRKYDRYTGIIFGFILLSFGVNLLGALGPELAFDSLWYHLTLPKIYLIEQKLSFIPGGLFYYSSMPKLTELLYVPAIEFFGETASKLIHFGFGVLGVYSLYKLSRLFLSQLLSMLVIAILASNLVFAWEMIASYNDLTWLFYEVLAFLTFTTFLTKKQTVFLVLTGVFIGFSIMTKVIGILSLVLYTTLLVYFFWPKLFTSLRFVFYIGIPAIIIPLPWFIFSYINTGNAFYPFFSGYLASFETAFFSIKMINPVPLIQSITKLFFFSPDPISPLYGIFFPLTVFVWKFFTRREKIVFCYCFVSLILWYIVPKGGGSRFILPYLPIFSLAAGIVISKILKVYPAKYIKTGSIGLVLFVFLITIGYRGIANMRYIPFLVGQESKSEFLSKNLEFQFADFYDTDGYFSEHVLSTDKVLLIGFHNLYYVDFPFVHESYYNDQAVTYIATQRVDLPNEYEDWELIYSNDHTLVKLYKRHK